MAQQNLSVASVIEKNRVDSGTPFLVLVDVTVVDPATGTSIEHIYMVNNDEDITFQGNLYVHVPFDIGLKQESGTQPEVSLSLRDFTGTVQAKMQLYGGGVGFDVVVMVVNADLLAAGTAEVTEYFEVISATSTDYVVSFSLGAAATLAKPFPRRRQMRNFCAWSYKDGNTCKYVGSLTTCDLTLDGANGCSAHTNTINFGAYPGITPGARYG